MEVHSIYYTILQSDEHIREYKSSQLLMTECQLFRIILKIRTVGQLKIRTVGVILKTKTA